MDAVVRALMPSLTPPRARAVAWLATFAVAAVAALVLGRRLAGALHEPLALGPLVATLVMATAIIAAARLLWPTHGGAPDRREPDAFAWLGTAALWAMCLGCAPANVHSWSWLAWLPLVGVDFLSRRGFVGESVVEVRGADRKHAAKEIPLSSSAEMPTALCSADIGSAVLGCSRPVQGGESEHNFVVQAVSRSRDAEGVESVRGTLVAEFAAGQRHATLAVGFCPPLAALPEIEVELVDGPDAAVKVTQAFAHGAQFEIRLAEPAEEACTAAIEFSAAPPSPV
jgi:hypothetical protein